MFKIYYKKLLVAFCAFFLIWAQPITTYAANNGKFKLTFTIPEKKVYHDIAIVFKADGTFQNIVDEMNDAFLLPYDVKVEFAAKDGPVYDPPTNTITMSYEFIFFLMTIYFEKYPKASDDAMFAFSIRATTFLLYHEMAHALIDMYELPIVGNEEVAADNLAVIIALVSSEQGYDIVMDSAELFDILDQTNKTYDEDELWDEHTLDSQRFYNIICLTYGKYPERVLKELKAHKNKKLLKFLDEKGDFCMEEYQRQVANWYQLLKPHLTPSDSEQDTANSKSDTYQGVGVKN